MYTLNKQYTYEIYKTKVCRHVTKHYQFRELLYFKLAKKRSIISFSFTKLKFNYYILYLIYF